MSKKLTESEIAYILDHKTVTEWSGLSLAERVARFHRQFPDRRITVYRLRKVYRQHLYKKKKIRRTKIIQPAHQKKIDEEAREAKF